MIIRIWMTMALFFLLLSPSVHAAEQSSDPMVLEWTTTRVWISKGELCAAGQFVNHREDIMVTGLNAFTMEITFHRADGSSDTFVGSPKQLPLCRIPAGGTRRVTLNFGPFDGQWKSWTTQEVYTFSYIDEMRR
nr:hypothetical protein [uncultured Selenomonas sp.]